MARSDVSNARNALERGSRGATPRPLASAGGAGVDTLASFVESLMSGSIDVIDLTQPLSEATPMIQLPPPFAIIPNWRTPVISHYDGKGPACYWISLEWCHAAVSQ